MDPEPWDRRNCFLSHCDGDDDDVDDVAIVQGSRATRRADSGYTAQLLGWEMGGMGRTVYTHSF